MKAAKARRDIFALDLPTPWKQALESLLPLYQARSMADLARRALQDFVSCHYTESQMRQRGLLASYQSLGKPDVLLFAIRRAEELRREDTSESGSAQEAVRRKAGGR